MQHVMEFFRMTRLAVLYYASTNVHPRLRDSVLMQYFFPQTATTMLMSTSAVQLQTMNQTTKYPNDPSRCKHPSCLRSHGAGGMSISICDLCGSASPTARTPLFPKGSDLGKIVSNRTAQPRASNQNSGSSASASGSYSQRSLLHDIIAETITSVPRCPYSLEPKDNRLDGRRVSSDAMGVQPVEDMEAEEEVWDPKTGTWGNKMDPQDWDNRPSDFPEGYQSQEDEELD